MNYTYQFVAIACAMLSWGAYGPVLHKGQAAMHHSRMRPFICVGLAYLAIAVILPYFFLGEFGEASSYRSAGTLWSFLAGTFAACGALGIIMAFNFGGKPFFVMPVVFGGAPVVSTFLALTLEDQWGNVNPVFWAGLILIISGAVMVLVLAPRGEAGTPATATGAS
jgi:peptidoglycan/LPS O-acetylase OafA/YrhL